MPYVKASIDFHLLHYFLTPKFKTHINLHGKIKGLQRTDIYEIPDVTLREALINACVHRDYTNRGRDIKVGIYDDIVNFVSTGGFPNTLTTSARNEGRSKIRNRVRARRLLLQISGKRSFLNLLNFLFEINIARVLLLDFHWQPRARYFRV